MVSSALSCRDALVGIVGEAFVRDADPLLDAVAGVAPSLVVSPGDEAQVAEVLRCVSRQSLAVVVRGGGTKLDWGAPPRRCDVVLSTSRLDAVVEHEPGDLVCVAQAGVRLEELQSTLAPHGQRLMLDPPHGVAATLGGIAAAGAWGPLRTRYGTARDLVIGARFVLADGTVGHSGGKVVKNVAGYDVGKLLIGSLGTLGVVTQLALRLHPLPRVSRTVVFEGLSAQSAAAAWAAVEASPIAASRIVLLWPEGALHVQVEGSEEGVEAQVAALRGLPFATQVGLSVGAGGNLHDTRVVASIGVPRSELPALLDRLTTAVADHSTILPSLGLAEAHLPAQTTPEAVGALRSWAESLSGHLLLRGATGNLAALAWPQPRDDDPSLHLMRSLKRSLDPTCTLSPGRFLGGI